MANSSVSHRYAECVSGNDVEILDGAVHNVFWWEIHIFLSLHSSTKLPMKFCNYVLYMYTVQTKHVIYGTDVYNEDGSKWPFIHEPLHTMNGWKDI
jgi:hypothetical protein